VYGGQSVVVDNVNATPEERAKLIRHTKAYGAHGVSFYFESFCRTVCAATAVGTARRECRT
jgi:predicted kinase